MSTSTTHAASGSTHAVPLHCPYCAGEDLWPHGDVHGAWACRECLRIFSVKFVGLSTPTPSNPVKTTLDRDDRRSTR
jgi:hypothetical protein